jgi:hypothetical protein
MKANTQQYLYKILGSPIFIVGSFILVGLMLAIFAWVEEDHRFVGSLLTNLAAGFLCLAVGVAVAIIAAARKFGAAARPLLEFIQQLKADDKIEAELARKSVVCAVAVLSESNVHRAITEDAATIEPAQAGEACPVCTLPVKLVPGDSKRRCFFCSLPDAVWNLRDD